MKIPMQALQSDETQILVAHATISQNGCYKIVNDMMGEWDQEAWSKVDSHYKKLTANQKNSGTALNRNPIIHGDYYSDAIDVSENDAFRLFLLWINLRVMTDHLAFIEDFLQHYF